MRRTRTRYILLLVALLHLVADAAFAGGVVLCVGPNDHRALETGHLGGCEVSTPKRDLAQLDTLPSDCSDSAVHSDPELVNENEDASKVAAPLLALFSSPPADRFLAGSEHRGHRRSPGLPPGLSLHRSTVLLL